MLKCITILLMIVIYVFIYIKQAFMAKMRDFGNFWSKNKRGGCGKVWRAIFLRLPLQSQIARHRHAQPRMGILRFVFPRKRQAQTPNPNRSASPPYLKIVKTVPRCSVSLHSLRIAAASILS